VRRSLHHLHTRCCWSSPERGLEFISGRDVVSLRSGGLQFSERAGSVARLAADHGLSGKPKASAIAFHTQPVVPRRCQFGAVRLWLCENDKASPSQRVVAVGQRARSPRFCELPHTSVVLLRLTGADAGPGSPTGRFVAAVGRSLDLSLSQATVAVK